MIKNNMRQVHPSEILKKEYLVSLGMTVNTLSIRLHVPASMVNEVIRERRGITPDIAFRLARFLNTTLQFWLNLQTRFDLKLTEIQLGDKIAREISPMQVVA